METTKSHCKEGRGRGREGGKQDQIGTSGKRWRESCYCDSPYRYPTPSAVGKRGKEGLVRRIEQGGCEWQTDAGGRIRWGAIWGAVDHKDKAHGQEECKCGAAAASGGGGNSIFAWRRPAALCKPFTHLEGLQSRRAQA